MTSALAAGDVGAEMALTLARALSAETQAAAGAATTLVSITCSLVAKPEPGEPLASAARIARKTRTLVFADADLTGAGGRTLMAASAVYRVG